MPQLKHKVTLFIVLFISTFNIYSQTSLSKINIASQYQLYPEKEIDVYGIKAEEGNVIIFLSFELPEGQETVNINFWGADKYESPVVNIDSLIVNEQYLGESEGYHFYEYMLHTDYSLIAVEMGNSGEQPSIIKEIYFDPQKLDMVLYSGATNLPVLERWINNKIPYKSTDLNMNDLDIYASHYSVDFPAASPPMINKKAESQEIVKDSSFLLFDNAEFSLEKKGFYLFQEDTTSNKGYGWRLESENFPDAGNLEELIPPLIYITTPQEYENLLKNPDKSTFDKLWLKLGGNPSITKSMIRKYYDRVEHANRYFTTYKEGWKTDRGMMYIVYGPPTEVFRSEEGEVWWYETDQGDEAFSFLRFSHVFYPYNYVLLRADKYRLSWFNKVDQLRNNIF